MIKYQIRIEHCFYYQCISKNFSQAYYTVLMCCCHYFWTNLSNIALFDNSTKEMDNKKTLWSQFLVRLLLVLKHTDKYLSINVKRLLYPASNEHNTFECSLSSSKIISMFVFRFRHAYFTHLHVIIICAGRK
jgi:hypothetical protein